MVLLDPCKLALPPLRSQFRERLLLPRPPSLINADALALTAYGPSSLLFILFATLSLCEIFSTNLFPWLLFTHKGRDLCS